MRNRYIRHINKLVLVCGLLVFASSCKYKDVAEANYPDQKVYFPAAREGRFIINTVAQPGKPYRYEVDLSAKKFNVPLSVFRGAVNNSGAFSVNIHADNDTINSLVTDGTLLNTELLPASEYIIPASVNMANGAERVLFSISINMDYLIANPGKLKAICLKLSGGNVTTNPAMDKLIVIIDPAVLNP